MPRLRRRARGFSLVEILVVGAIVSVGLALTLPAVQRARQDARRNACKNNLKQMALAMHNYHDAFVTFPPGWIVKDVKPAAGPGYGWGTFILPYVDQAPLYNQIDFSVPPDITSSDRLQTRLNVYRCPDDTSEETNPVRDEYGTSNYSGNYGNETLPGSVDASDKASGIFFRNSKVGMRDITDGTSNTLLLGEKCISSAAGIWMGVRSNQNAGDSVTACAHETRMNTVIDSFSSRHGGGVHFALCDGSVRFISDKIDSQSAKADKMGTFQMLSHKSDGHPVGQY